MKQEIHPNVQRSTNIKTVSSIVFKDSFLGSVMIGNNSGGMWLIAELVLCKLGVMFQNWKRRGEGE